MRFTLPLTSFALVWALAGPVSASASTTAHSAGRLQLSVPMDVLGVQYGERQWPGGGEHRGWSTGIGPSRYSLGAVSPALPGIELGYGVSDAWLVHVQLGFSHDADAQQNGEVEQTAYRIQPGVSYAMAPGELVRPVFGLRVAIDRFDGDAGDGTGVSASARAGAQIHTSDHFSVDPYVELGYRDVSQRNDGGLGGLASLQRGEQWVLALSSGFALSLWL